MRDHEEALRALRDLRAYAAAKLTSERGNQRQIAALATALCEVSSCLDNIQSYEQCASTMSELALGQKGLR